MNPEAVKGGPFIYSRFVADEQKIARGQIMLGSGDGAKGDQYTNAFHPLPTGPTGHVLTSGGDDALPEWKPAPAGNGTGRDAGIWAQPVIPISEHLAQPAQWPYGTSDRTQHQFTPIAGQIVAIPWAIPADAQRLTGVDVTLPGDIVTRDCLGYVGAYSSRNMWPDARIGSQRWDQQDHRDYRAEKITANLDGHSILWLTFTQVGRVKPTDQTQALGKAWTAAGYTLHLPAVATQAIDPRKSDEDLPCFALTVYPTAGSPEFGTLPAAFWPRKGGALPVYRTSKAPNLTPRFE